MEFFLRNFVHLEDVPRSGHWRIRLARMPRKLQPKDERDAIVERLREFLRLNYVTAAQLSDRLGVRAVTLYTWLSGGQPADARIAEGSARDGRVTLRG